MMLTRRQLAFAGGAAAIAWRVGPSEGAAAVVDQPATPLDPWALVNPELLAPLRAMEQLNGAPTWSMQTLPGSRRAGDARASGPNDAPRATPAYVERRIAGPRGAPEVRVFVINAGTERGLRPAVLHMHGGGYITGSAAASIRPLQRVAQTHDCVAVTVDYRLAPETHFPGSLEDNYAALRWLHAHAEELGVDRGRIAVMGESAGGGHAAALAIAARDRGEVPLILQVLIYPMLDDRTGSTRPVPPYIGRFVWTPQGNRFGWTSLLGEPAGSAKVPAGSVPARVPSVAGLAPAFIGVGSIDLFAEEDLAYAQRLILAGVATEVAVVPGAFHAFDIMVPQASVSKEFTATWNAALGRAFAGKGAA